MDSIGQSPFTWLEFDADGTLVDPGAPAALAALIAAPGIGDLVVLSHGWQTDKAGATTLYGMLWRNVCAALARTSPASIAVCGVLWPAKAYRDDFDTATVAAASGGQTLSVAGPQASRDLTDDEFQTVLADFRDLFGDRAEATLDAATDAAEGITGARANALFRAAGAALTSAGSPADSELAADVDPIVNPGDPRTALLGLAEPPTATPPADAGGTQGLGDIVGQTIEGTRAAVARLLNQLTYFEMKTRAGVVGGRLGSAVLPTLAPPHPLRLHLVGHSFGGRLVTAAASALPAALPAEFYSLTLLQGAFSHNALAATVQPGVPGAFANVIGRPSGPISITHTHNDLACTIAYALASRLSRDTTQSLGDQDDAFGAMGANGAQKLAPDASAPPVESEDFAPVRGKVNEFLADAYILKTATSDAHNNVTNPTCGKLLAAVIES